MSCTFGFIGVGNMGSAMARAAVKKIDPAEILLSNRTASKAVTLAAALGCQAGSNVRLAAEAEYLFLGVKPQMMEGLFAEIRPVLAQREKKCVLVSMAAGITMEAISAMAGGDYPVIRIMPNTPCAVGAGVVLYDANALVTGEQLDFFVDAMSAAGFLDHLDEHLLAAGSTVSGCGPAFLFPFIEALADGGVYCGLPRAKALQYAAKMCEGSARLMLATGNHPGPMKDAVCSPGGTTIAGVRVLEERGFRGAAMDAVIAAVERTKELEK